MRFMNTKIFAVVANYPWDSTEVQPWTKSSLFREHREGERGQYTADNKEFQELAMVYSTNHKTMSQVIFMQTLSVVIITQGNLLYQDRSPSFYQMGS